MSIESSRPIRSAVVVTNPTSGHGNEVARVVRGRLTEHAVSFTEISAPTAAESVRLVRDSLAYRPDAVICVGGDGLISVTLGAIAESGVPLGLVPSGTGNDLARTFGVPTDDPAAAVDLLVRGRTRQMDLGRIRSRTPGVTPMWFATVAATGFDARVTLRANRMRWPRGPLRYSLAALAELGGTLAAPYRIDLAGAAPGVLDNPSDASGHAVINTEAVLVAVGNTRTYGGGMLICPDAEFDDGLLDLTLVGAVPRWEMLRLLPALSAGKRIDHPAVTQYRASEITLSAVGAPATADGDPAGELPITVHAVPRALAVLVP